MTLDDIKGMRGLKYVASPYTQYITIDSAFEDVSVAVAKLMASGFTGVISPITHSHPVARRSGGRIDPLNQDFWEAQNEELIESSVACIVVELPGWQTSKGVSHEIKAFKAANKPIVYVNPEKL